MIIGSNLFTEAVKTTRLADMLEPLARLMLTDCVDAVSNPGPGGMTMLKQQQTIYECLVVLKEHYLCEAVLFAQQWQLTFNLVWQPMLVSGTLHDEQSFGASTMLSLW